MSLPKAFPESLEHSQRVVQHIRNEIESANGWINFARFMELALYAPGLGYYSAGATKFGVSGDFVTAPEMSSLFGRTLARPISAILQNGGDILELGAGSGKLASDLLHELEKIGSLPKRYQILELSADLRDRQRTLLEKEAVHLLPRVSWLEELPKKFNGVVLGNEVLDALPIHLIYWQRKEIFERGVGLENDHFVFRDRVLPEGELRRVAEEILPGDDYLSEISVAVPALIRSIGGMLQQGAAIFIDYGFQRHEYYHPQRSRGTLMCHYRHHAHDDPFYLPGLQDITAHIDFTVVENAAAAAGLTIARMATQAQFLIECGITEILAEVDPRNAAAYLPLANQVQRLLSPAEMGELFKVIVLKANNSD